MQSHKPFDIFLSHSSKDKPAVTKFAKRLVKDGMRVWYDMWEMRIGDMIARSIDKGLSQSRILCLFFSKDAADSEWAEMEWNSFKFGDPANRLRRLIVIRLDNTPLPNGLAQFLWCDWRKASETQCAILLQTIKETLRFRTI